MGTPFARIIIGDDVFISGDGLLQDWSVTLAEQAGGSTCRFTIHDPAKFYTDKYFAYIEKIQGLVAAVAPSDKESKSGTSAGKFSGSLPADIAAFDQNRVRQAIAYYQSQGLSNAGIAALVSNMLQESGLEPGAEANDQSSPSLGLIQWTFERTNGMPSDFEGQLEFALTEMERDGGSPGLLEKLKDPSLSLGDLQQPVQDWIRWGHEGDRWGYAQSVLEALEDAPAESAAKSVDDAKNPKTKPTREAMGDGEETTDATAEDKSEKTGKATKSTKTETGAQITVGLGFDGQIHTYQSFLHTGLTFDLFAPNTLTFTGQAAAWILSQRKKNTAYQNVTFKDIATKITGDHGLNLIMPVDGATYEYFPQRGISDYDVLTLEAIRLGLKVSNTGNTVTIDQEKYGEVITLEYGKNLGLKFTVDHSASSDSSGGARSSDPSKKSTTGERKFTVDPQTGALIQEQLEDPTGAGASAGAGAGAGAAVTATTGSHLSIIKPVEEKSDESAPDRKENAKRVKGIIANFTAPTTPQMLGLNPDTPFQTVGFSTTLDRFWVVDTVTHKGGSGECVTEGTVYSPLKNKNPEKPKKEKAKKGKGSNEKNADGFILPTTGFFTSPFGMRNGRMHNGVDLASDLNTPVWAAADGEVTQVVSGCVDGDQGCGAGFGNYVEITHDNGYVTLYAHLESVSVSQGDTIAQGENLGGQGNTGHSYGVHLHWQVEEGGSPIDPETVVSIPEQF